MRKRKSSAQRQLALIIVGLLVLAGLVYAAYTAWQGTVEVTVEESLIVTFKEGGCSWDAGSKTLSCGIDPGETVENTFNVENVGGGDLTVNAVLSGLPASISYLVDPSNFALDAGDNQDVDITITAAGDIAPTTASASLDFTRE